jgi:anaerobic selenocysteine-containing dehydrogenase
VPTKNLFALAREFATSPPALAIGERGPSFHPNDLYTRMAIHSLNALVGSIGVEGGIVRQGRVPLTEWEKAESDAIAARGMAMPRIGQRPQTPAFSPAEAISAVPENLLSGRPYALDTLLLYYANPVFSTPNGQAWRQALEGVPFLVSFSPFMDETTNLADLILPDSTYLERWQDDQVTHLAGITLFGIGKPVVPPLYDTRQTEDVVLQLAKGLGEPVASALSWENFEEVLFTAAQGLHEAGRGHIVMPSRDERFDAILARQGYREEPFEEFDDFWDALLAKGVWWDPNDTYVGMRQLFNTPSGGFEFYSQTLRRDMLRAAGGEKGIAELARSLGLKAREDLLFLPHFEAPEPKTAGSEKPEEGAFIFNTYKLMSQAGGRGAAQPWLQEQPAIHLEGGWSSWVEINPAAAAALGIENGDWVTLTSVRGSLKVRAHLFEGTPPDVLNMPFGQGHTAFGRWARGRGVNPNTILIPVEDPMRGLPVWSGTRVRLSKA